MKSIDRTPEWSTLPVRERALRLLDETAKHYNKNNRAIVNSVCVYRSTPQSDGCAIGRYLPEKLAQSLPTGVGNNHVFNKLPQWLQAMTQVVLKEIQMFHDREINWDENGLSAKGLQEYEFLKQEITKHNFTNPPKDVPNVS